MKFSGMSIDFIRQSIQEMDEADKNDAKELFAEVLESVNNPDRQAFQSACEGLNEILGDHSARFKQFNPN